MKNKLLYLLIVGIVSIIFQVSPLFASAYQNDPTDVGITFTGTQQSSATVDTSESKKPSVVSGSEKKNFPNTGEKKCQFFSLLGVLLIFLGLLLFKKLRRKI